MSVQTALAFIQASNRNPRIREALRRLDPDMDLQQLLAVAASWGFVFSEADFRTAFRCDWGMRAHHLSYRRSAVDEEPESSAAHTCDTDK